MLDITALAEANRRIAVQAREDHLTGLGNRLALTAHVEDLLARDEPFALLMMDLDRFKEVNDTLGHEAGDSLLRVMAERITQVAGEVGLIVRLGGDEFALVVEGITEACEIVPLLERLGAASAEPLVVGDVRFAVTSSTGVALSDPGRLDRPTVMRHADIAMYEAKRRAVTYCIFDASLEQTSTMQLTLAATVPNALRRGELLLYFQPKIDLGSGTVVGAEGLVRWAHPEYGLLPPAAFLDLLLVSEHANEFARFTIEQTAIAMAHLLALGHEIPMAANLTIGALRDIDFGDRVLAILDEYGIDPSALTIELTGSDVLLPGAGALPSVERLTHAGVTISIDDFGTGHSSLDRLRVFDVGELKIDRAYVNGMATSPLDRQIFETIIGLAHRMGCRVTAEGVETEDQAATLLQLGCSTAQGYLYARPMPLPDLMAMADVAAFRRSPASIVPDARAHAGAGVAGGSAASPAVR